MENAACDTAAQYTVAVRVRDGNDIVAIGTVSSTHPFSGKVRTGHQPLHPCVRLMVVDAHEAAEAVRPVAKWPLLSTNNLEVASDHTPALDDVQRKRGHFFSQRQ
jgi:hypothetical protein